MWLLRPPYEHPDAPVSAADVMGSFRGKPGLYVHVPFCRTACPFCPYNKVAYEEALVTPYFDALAGEARAYVAHAKGPFTSLYVGGGTPTLCLDELEAIGAELRVEGERAIEVLPDHATEPNLSRLRAMGFDYLSLGVQSFDRRVLRHLGRNLQAEASRAALARVCDRFACVDVDLIFDTAFQDVDTFLRDVETCFRARVDQVSTYPLMRFGMTPFGKSAHAPDVEHRALRRAESLAERHGYERRSVWTFHRPDAPAYSSITRPWYLGLGAGAATFTGRSFLVNHFSLNSYATDVAEGRLPIARRLDLSGWRAAAYHLFWALYTGRIDAEGLPEDFPEARVLAAMLRLGTISGHLAHNSRGLRLTRRGYDAYHDLERWVTYRYIEPLWEDLTRAREADSARAS